MSRAVDSFVLNNLDRTMLRAGPGSGKKRPAPFKRCRATHSGLRCYRSSGHVGYHDVRGGAAVDPSGWSAPEKRPAPAHRRGRGRAEGAGMLEGRLKTAREAITLLRLALEASKFAGSKRTAARIRLAVTSAQGAIRHLEGLAGAARREGRL